MYNVVVGHMTFSTNNEIVLESNELETKLKGYLGGMSESKYKALLTNCELDKRTYEDKKKTMESKVYNIFKQVMKECFGLEISVSSRGTKNSKRKNYNNKSIQISCEEYNNLIKKYNPYKLKVSSQLSLVDLEYWVRQNQLENYIYLTF